MSIYEAKHEYRPAPENVPPDIPLRYGDIVTNLEYLDNGWAMGFNATIRKPGIFPRRYVQCIEIDSQDLPLRPPLPKRRPEYAVERLDDYCRSDEIVSWVDSLNFKALKEAITNVVLNKRKKSRVVYSTLWFMAGLILGVLTFVGCQYALEYPLYWSLGIAVFSAFLIIIGVLFSTQCRAIVVMCIPTLSTKSGRLVLTTLAVGLLLRGPIENITENASELAAVSSCAMEVVHNSSEALQELASEPLRKLAQGIKDTLADLEAITETVDRLVEPVAAAIRAANDAIIRIEAALTQAKNNCEGDLDRTKLDCNSNLDAARTDCRDRFGTLQNAVCNVLLRSSVSCDEFTVGNEICDRFTTDKLCDPLDLAKATCAIIPPSLDGVVEELSRKLEEAQRYLSTNVQIKDTIISETNSTKNGTTIAASIKEELKGKTAVIQSIIVYVNRFLTLTVLLLIFQSFKYLRAYSKDDSHDNLYMTELFKDVDERRLAKEKTTLLPLTPNEKDTLIHHPCKVAKHERKTFLTGLSSTMFSIISGAVVIAFDHLLYEAIQLTNRHSLNTRVQIRAQADIGIEVESGGYLSDFLNKLVGALRAEQEFEHTIDLGVCLPVGRPPTYTYLIGLGVIYLLLLVIVFLQTYILRLRHKVADHFYPDREKSRVTFLYRKLLRQRIVMLKELKDVLRETREQLEKDEISRDFWDDLKSMLGCSKHKEECVICGTKETRIEGTEFRCPDCNSFFCKSCWEMILDKKCACDPSIPLVYDQVEDSDFEDDLDEEIIQEYSYACDIQQDHMRATLERRHHQDMMRHQFARRSFFAEDRV